MFAATSTADPVQRRSRRAYAVNGLAALSGRAGPLRSAATLLSSAAMADGASLRGKLVRDWIPEIILQAGLVPVIETASPADYHRYVRAKLQEELRST